MDEAHVGFGWYVRSVTASLPVPHDDHSDDTDAAVPNALEESSPIAKNPAKPRAPRKTTSASQKAAADAGTAAKPKPRRAPSKPRAKAPVKPRPVADPGPPPPLPADLVDDEIVIPPKPPLPAAEVAVAAAEEGGAEVDDVEIVEVEPDPVIVSEPEVVEAPEVIAEPEPEAAPIPVSEPEPEPEPESEPEPELETEPESAFEVVDPEPESDVIEVFEALAEDPVVLSADFSTPGAEGGVAALSLRGIRKSFGSTRAVDDVDLTVPAGTFYGLVGPNGAGKTTTLSMIAGLLRPDRGSIVVGGIDATAHPVDAKRLMGVLPDRLRTFDRLTGRQLLYYYGVLRGLKPAVVESRTADLARAFDLTDALGRVVSDYSAGMAKKVMLAGAMIHSPRLLVLDEPFEAVDPVSSAIILDILSAYVAHGGTVILSSHGMELVERVCSRVAVLVAGQVLAEGTVDEVRGELTLEQRFIELAGGLSDVEGLEWLHTFSD